jgi:hypothetical protein
MALIITRSATTHTVETIKTAISDLESQIAVKQEELKSAEAAAGLVDKKPEEQKQVLEQALEAAQEQAAQQDGAKKKAGK